MPTTDEQLRLLDALAAGRGRYAAMAYLTADGAVTVYRGGRVETAFALQDVMACEDAGWVCRAKYSGRYRITPAGRAKRQEER